MFKCVFVLFGVFYCVFEALWCLFGCIDGVSSVLCECVGVMCVLCGVYNSILVYKCVFVYLQCQCVIYGVYDVLGCLLRCLLGCTATLMSFCRLVYDDKV